MDSHDPFTPDFAQRTHPDRVTVGGAEIRPGDRVKLRPLGGRIFSILPWTEKPPPSSRLSRILRTGCTLPSLSMTIRQ